MNLRKRLDAAHKLRYVAANVLASGLGFGRNLLFMKTLGVADMGQVALMQTIAMSVGFLQFGVINGAYRIYASGVREHNKALNNSLHTLFLLLGGLILALALSGLFDLSNFGVHPATLLVGLAAGVSTQASTWANNALIADGQLSRSNVINLASVSLSLLVAIFSPQSMALTFALLSMLLQPACVVLLAFILQPYLRPTHFEISGSAIKRALELGFIPFIAGIFSLMNSQIERWTITYLQGPESLGHFYLAILYSTIFVLVPTSMLNLYFPRTIRAFEAGKRDEFIGLLKRHLIELLAYLSIAVILTFILLPWFVGNYLDKYKGSELLVYLSLPGLIALVLCNPIALVYQSTKVLKPLLIYGALTLFINSLLLYVIYRLNIFNLDMVAIAKSATNIFALIYLTVALSRTRNISVKAQGEQ